MTGKLNIKNHTPRGAGQFTAAGAMLCALLAAVMLGGCQDKLHGPGTAVRTPSFAGNGAETLYTQPPPKPDIVIGLPNRPGQPATVTTVITPVHQPAATQRTSAYPPLPTVTAVHEEILPAPKPAGSKGTGTGRPAGRSSGDTANNAAITRGNWHTRTGLH